MGLLESAQKKKPSKKKSEETTDQNPQLKKTHKPTTFSEKAHHIKAISLPKPTQTPEPENKPKSLFERALLKRKKLPPPTKQQIIRREPRLGIDVVEEEKGIGWKEQGSKQIVYDNNINEYIYEVIEPQLTELELQIKNELARLFKMLADVDTFDMDKEEKLQFLEATLDQIIIDNNLKFIPKPSRKEKKQEEQLPPPEFDEQQMKDRIYYHLFRDFLGYGRIDILMHDDGIEDISCDGPDTPIFIHHRKYEAIETNIYFDTEEELNSFIVRLCQISGKQISIYSPIVDGKLPDGSRLQSTLARTVTKGSTFTIRKFRENPLTPMDLIKYKSLSIEMAAYFWMAIENNASILFCGGTASGKTTALNALLLFIPASHKIISIEDTREVNLPHKNWIAGTTRTGFSSAEENKTGKDIDMFDLIRAALRQRPRVIIVGEVRGREAYSLFQAMATGHTSYATVHASDIHTLIQRLENPPISLPRALLTSLDVIVFQNAVDIGGKMVRRMTSVTEIIKLDSDTNQLIFMAPFQWISKTDDRFESSKTSKILNRIKQQNDWTEERLEEEITNRMKILEWMKQKEDLSYKDFGKIVAYFRKYPKELLERANKEMKQMKSDKQKQEMKTNEQSQEPEMELSKSDEQEEEEEFKSMPSDEQDEEQKLKPMASDEQKQEMKTNEQSQEPEMELGKSDEQEEEQKFKSMTSHKQKQEMKK